MCVCVYERTVWPTSFEFFSHVCMYIYIERDRQTDRHSKKTIKSLCNGKNNQTIQRKVVKGIGRRKVERMGQTENK